jgi:hypothetical protein
VIYIAGERARVVGGRLKLSEVYPNLCAYGNTFGWEYGGVVEVELPRTQPSG